MATEKQPVQEQILPSTSEERSLSARVFKPEDTLDQPCNVVLVVEDGKEFKAHRKVLSEASPFFEKLLNSDMKESKEGIVRLEMFSESVMAATLEFIYTGHVQMLTEDNARDLIVVADYLLLPKLKTLAEGVLTQKLSILNCLSTFYFSERYLCKELVSKSKKFILANFTAVYTANLEDVLSMSSKEVEMWISSNELNVCTEEDVFKIILAWIDHDRSKRNEYFAELFRQVRLVYVSRDFLSSDVVTNDLVKENEGCLDLVKDAMSRIDSKNCDGLSFPPRKSLETPAIVMRKDEDFLCYFPDEDNWYRLCEIPSEYRRFHNFFPCEGKLYSTARVQLSADMISFSPYSNIWMQLPNLGRDRYLWKIFVGNEHEMYALVSEICFSCKYITSLQNDPCNRKHSSFISRYKPESHSWEDMLSFDHLYPFVREQFCIVASDCFIYFIGGVHVKGINSDIFGKKYIFLRDVDRYHLRRHQWDKVADIQVARRGAQGVAVNGKVFISGGDHQGQWQYLCEMYDETTNEWQFIASCRNPKTVYTLLVVDSKLYSVYYTHEIQSPGECTLQRVSVEFYDPEKNEWTMKSEITLSLRWATKLNACSMRIFKGISNIRQLESLFPDSLAGANTTQDTSLHDRKTVKQKCFII